VGSTPNRTVIFTSSPKHPENLWGPPSFLFNIYQVLLPQRLKQPGLEADHPPQYSAELKNNWNYPFSPPLCLQGRQTDNFSTTAAENTNLAVLNNTVKLPIINTNSEPLEICVQNT